MKRQAILTLPTGEEIPISECRCIHCRRLLACCLVDGHPRVWDALSFLDDGLIRYHKHRCRPSDRTELARDRKLEADRDTR